MKLQTRKQRVLENSNCGAFLEGTQMESISNERIHIEKLTKRDYLLTSEGFHFLAKAIWKRKETCYYIIEAANGKSVKLTGQQFVLTDTGWKRVKNLRQGNHVMCYDFFEGRQYYELTSMEKEEEEEFYVYSVSLGDRTVVANGFVCSDYDMQKGK